MHVREQLVWIATAVLEVQHRIINYSQAVCCACIRIFGRGKTARLTTRLPSKYRKAVQDRYSAEVEIFIVSIQFDKENLNFLFVEQKDNFH